MPAPGETEPLVLVKPNTLADDQTVTTPRIRVKGVFPGLAAASKAPDFSLTVKAGPIHYEYHADWGDWTPPTSASEYEVVLPGVYVHASCHARRCPPMRKGR